MSVERSGPGKTARGTQVPTPSGTENAGREDLRRLGERLTDRVEEVVDLTVERTTGAGHKVDAAIQGRFEQICRSSTLAVARWISGASPEVAIEIGRESWEIFGELTARRTASLNEVTWRFLLWRNVMTEVLSESAVQLKTPAQALQEAINFVHLSLEFSLLRMSASFEAGREQIEEELSSSNRQGAETLALLDTLQSKAPVGLGYCDLNFRLLRLNESLARTSGIPIEEQLGRTVDEVIPEIWPQLQPVYARVLETGEAVINLENSGTLLGDPGRVHTWLTSLYPVRIGGQKAIGIGIVVVDITDRKEMEEKLKQLSEHDYLTGVYNRRGFIDQLDRAISNQARYGHSGALLILDIDNFKLTNDSHGHAAGDHLLVSVAEVLAARLRRSDIIARIGGDEFAILLQETTAEQALRVTLDLRSRLSERPLGPPVSVSIGIAPLGAAGKLQVDDLLAAADSAMYQSKKGGGDQATVFQGQVGEILSRVRDLQDAVENGRFVLYGQPIIELKSGRVAFRELLIRMRSKTGAVVPPSEFLPLAEEVSLMGQIDRWVLGEAIALAEAQPLTVNLSARSVGDPSIIATIRKAITAGLDPHHLTFEITETAAIGDFERAGQFANMLKDLGCGMALDDFGTGFGTFTYLKRLPAQYLKIDIEFVRDINDDPTDLEIVRSIVRIAHTLGKQTIAEGVENESVLETVRNLGVDYAQGWHLGMPERTSN